MSIEIIFAFPYPRHWPIKKRTSLQAPDRVNRASRVERIVRELGKWGGGSSIVDVAGGENNSGLRGIDPTNRSIERARNNKLFGDAPDFAEPNPINRRDHFILASVHLPTE